MQLLFHIFFRRAVRRLAPHFDRSPVAIKMFAASAIVAVLAAGITIKVSGFANPYLVHITLLGALAGLCASLFLIWNDAKKQRVTRSGQPAIPWTRWRVAKVLGIIFLAWSILAPLGLLLWDKVSKQP